MDDMKKLVERYKQELMEYSRKAQPQPKPKLEFPEMTEPEAADLPTAQGAVYDKAVSNNEEIAHSAAESEKAMPDDTAVDRTEFPETQSDTATNGTALPETQGDTAMSGTALPEMQYNTADGSEIAATGGSQTASENSAAERTPEIIGYGGDDFLARFNSIFAKDDYSDEIPQYSGVSTVTPQQAEELPDIPESGESADEQLGRRSFDLQQETVNNPDDIQPLEQQGTAPPAPQQVEYATLDEFITANNRTGTVRFRTNAARGAFPVAGARVVISHIIGGRKHIFYDLLTNESGLTEVVTLPAPPKELSETPDSEILPYADYTAEVTADGYTDVLINNMPVFEGVMSVQRVAFVPALNGRTDVINETEPDLNGGA